jgi:hypothetical protein
LKFNARYSTIDSRIAERNGTYCQKLRHCMTVSHIKISPTKSKGSISPSWKTLQTRLQQADTPHFISFHFNGMIHWITGGVVGKLVSEPLETTGTALSAFKVSLPEIK